MVPGAERDDTPGAGGSAGVGGSVPPVLEALLRRVLPARDRDDLVFEMAELHRGRAARAGRRRAHLWYLGAVVGFGVRLGRDGAAAVFRDAADDVRYGMRVLGRRPGYAVASALTLALGVGGVAATFAAADHVVLKPVAGVERPGELVTIRLGSSEGPRASWPISHPEFVQLREGLAELVTVAGRSMREVNLTAGDGGGRPVRTRAEIVSSGWFETLGVGFAAGRGLTPGLEPEAASDGEIVVAFDVATSLAPSPAEAVGRTVRLDGVPFRVVGVTEAGFGGVDRPASTRAWVGASAFRELDSGVDASTFDSRTIGLWEALVGRVRPGVSASVVGARAEQLRQADIRAENFGAATMVAHFEYQTFEGVGLDPGLRRFVGRTLLYLVVGAGFLLLLVTANVTNLTLTHAASRRGQLSVRRALGASRFRLLRQQMAEQGVLAAAATLLGVGVAWLGIRLLNGTRLDEFGGALDGLELDARAAGVALLLAVGVSWAAAVVAGRVSTVVRSSEAFGPGGHVGPRRSRRARAVLAGVQVAFSTILVVGAGLMARTVVNLRNVPLGLEPDGVLAWSFDPEREGRSPEEVAAVLRTLASSLDEQPDVTAAGVAFPEPLQTSYLTSWLLPEGASEDDRGVVGAHLQVGGDFLGAMGVEFLAGGDFERTFSATAGEGRIILSESAVDALFPGVSPADAVGRTVRRPRSEEPIRVVGVVSSLRLTGPRDDPPPVFIRPWAEGWSGVEAVGWARSRSGGAMSLVGTVRSVSAAVDPSLPIHDVRTVREQADRMAAESRVVAGLAVAVSLLGLLLSAVGLHGILGYAVLERRREIGVRTALGARRSDIVWSVVASGLRITVLGLIPGLVGAALLTRTLDAYLYRVDPLDPAAWTVGLGLLFVVTLAAAGAPARRATDVPVVEILRSER